MERSVNYPALDDDEGIDGITMAVVPRLKTSGLSGDEWRTSVCIRFWRKGRMLMERHTSSFDAALAGANWWFQVRPECFEDGDPGENVALWQHGPDFCMQPGCSKQPTVFYRMTKRGDGRGAMTGRRDLYDWEAPMRGFCHEHKYRGDSDFDDSMDIYEEVEGSHNHRQGEEA